MHTIRLKVGESEFELVGSMEQVTTAWKALQPAVVSAMKPPAPAKPMRARNAAAAEAAAPRRAKRPPRRARAQAGNRNERAEVMQKLGKADIATFPELPSDTKSLYTGLATLRWARDQAGVEGLSLTEIHKFVAEKTKHSKGVEAFRAAFKHLRAGELHSTGSPKVYRLMAPGEKLLDAYLQTLAVDGSEQTSGTPAPDQTVATNGAEQQSAANGSEQQPEPNSSEQPFAPNGVERAPAPNGLEQPVAANGSETDAEHPVAATDQEA